MPPPKPQRRAHSPLAAFLSYLVPGLGQIYQGRIGKGSLFLVCLYGLFFYGQVLGGWKNVYLPDTSQPIKWLLFPRLAGDLWNRIYYVGQFWIGVAAWPAIWQYVNHDGTEYVTQLGAQVADGQVAERLGVEEGALIVKVTPNRPAAKAGLHGAERDESGRNSRGDAIVALDGEPIRNVRSLFSALDHHQSGDLVNATIKRNGDRQDVPMTLQGLTDPNLETYQRAPPEEEINRLQRDGDKTWDLGWIYTVIAGVLNILVVYDAYAGPALTEPEKKARPEQEAVVT
jgi:hypothetical protein